VTTNDKQKYTLTPGSVAIAVFEPRLMILPSDLIIRFNPLFPGEPPARTYNLQFPLTDSSSIETYVLHTLMPQAYSIWEASSSNLRWYRPS
jgi:hypothetical protein